MSTALPPLSAQLIADTTLWRAGLAEGARQLHSFRAEASSATSSIAGLFSGGLGVGAGLSIVSSALNVAKEGLMELGSVAVSALGKGVKLAAEYEQSAVAFETMLGSAKQAKEMMQSLSDFGNTTPLKLPELTDASRRLLAYGVAAEQIMPTLKALGDVGSGLQIKVGDLADIYGKAKSQGVAQMEDINQLAGRGIPIIGELAKQFRVSESAVRGLVSAGKVGFPEIQLAFKSLSGEGGRFHGMLAKQGETMSGLMSTVGDSMDAVLRNVGQSLAQNLDFKSALKFSIDAINEAGKLVMPTFEAIAHRLKDFGVSGANAGNVTRSAFEGIVMAGAYAVDYGIRPIIAGFYGIRSAIESVQAFTINMFAELVRGAEIASQALSKLSMGKIKPMDPLSGFLRQDAASHAAEANKLFWQGSNALLGGSEVERANGWFKKMAADRAAAATAAAAPAPIGEIHVARDFSKSAALWKSFQKDMTTLAGEMQKGVAGKFAEGVKQWQDVLNDGRRVWEATRTPIERLQLERNHLATLLQQGAIDKETFDRAFKAADSDFRKTIQVAPNAGAAIERRTSFRTVGTPEFADPSKDIPQKQLNNGLAQTAHLAKIVKGVTDLAEMIGIADF